MRRESGRERALKPVRICGSGEGRVRACDPFASEIDAASPPGTRAHLRQARSVTVAIAVTPFQSIPSVALRLPDIGELPFPVGSSTDAARRPTVGSPLHREKSRIGTWPAAISIRRSGRRSFGGLDASQPGDENCRRLLRRPSGSTVSREAASSPSASWAWSTRRYGAVEVGFAAQPHPKPSCEPKAAGSECRSR